MPGSASSENRCCCAPSRLPRRARRWWQAGRRLFGQSGFRGTSVEDLAREARLTTGALDHHFPTKTATFEAVFMQAHTELMAASTEAAMGVTDGWTSWRWASTRPSTACCSPMCNGSSCWTAAAGSGLARQIDLDEQYAHAVIVGSLKAAAKAGTIQIDDPETATRLLLGALTRGAMLIDDSLYPVKTRHAVAKSMRALLNSFTVT